MKICLAASAGGHLTELIELLSHLKKCDVFFFTFKTDYLKNKIIGKRTYYTADPHRNIIKLFLLILISIRIFFKEKPDVIITTGAQVAVPISIIGKIFGKKLIFIETSSRITEPSLTGKILYPFADLFIVQWKSLLKKYGKKAVYGGLLI